MELPIASSGRDGERPSRVTGLVGIERAAAELGIGRGALWQKLHRSGIPIHRVRRNGLEEAAIDAVTFERLRRGNVVSGPRALSRSSRTRSTEPEDSLSGRVRRLEDDSELARCEARAHERQLLEARERLEVTEAALREAQGEAARLALRLEDADRVTLAQTETAKRLVASEERADRLARRLIEVEERLAREREHGRSSERLQVELDEVRGRLLRADERCALLAVELDRTRSEHAEELEVCQRELDRRACQNGGLKSQLTRARSRLERARRELELLREVERSQARYCDRLEERLRAARSAPES